MAWTLVTSSQGVPTTAARDTTGANLIVLVTGFDSATSVSDNKGNTWTPLTLYKSSSHESEKMYYCFAPTVGSGHTFTVSPSYGVMFMSAFSGAVTSPFESENGAGFLGTTSVSTGSVTPAQDGDLIVSGLCLGNNGSSPAINSGFTISESRNAVAGVSYGGAMAYLFQTSAAAVNPQWSWTVSVNGGAGIAVFKGPLVVSGKRTIMTTNTKYWSPH